MRIVRFGNIEVEVLFGKRKHCGGLDDSLKTSVYITEEEFERMSKKYHFYGVDNRCNQIMFITNDMTKSYTWLFIELKEIKYE